MFALALLSPALLHAQTPELDSLRRDPMGLDTGPSSTVRPPVIVNTPDPRFRTMPP